jgi:hypothetical protein
MKLLFHHGDTEGAEDFRAAHFRTAAVAVRNPYDSLHYTVSRLAKTWAPFMPERIQSSSTMWAAGYRDFSPQTGGSEMTTKSKHEASQSSPSSNPRATSRLKPV